MPEQAHQRHFLDLGQAGAADGFDVCERRGTWDQVVALEAKADLAVSHLRELISSNSRTSNHAGESGPALGIQAAEDAPLGLLLPLPMRP